MTVSNCTDTHYTVVTVECGDRPKLLFDVVCVLTDLNYVIHHAVVSSAAGAASQEFFVHTMAGGPVRSEEERRHLQRCVRAAIQRRLPQVRRTFLPIGACAASGSHIACSGS